MQQAQQPARVNLISSAQYIQQSHHRHGSAVQSSRGLKQFLSFNFHLPSLSFPFLAAKPKPFSSHKFQNPKNTDSILSLSDNKNLEDWASSS